MAEFLDTFDIERKKLLEALDHFETVWGRFQERRALQIDEDDISDSLLSSELALVRHALDTTEFSIGLFGLIKRGKSTLLNALIGREVSAMHVTPETAVPVYVTYNDAPGAVVHFADGTRKHVAVEDVVQYSSQKHNNNNQLGVTHVDQEVPVGFLRNGIRLIDTPGLDDAEADDTYTSRTMQELDAVDAGVVVFLSPPTVGRTEISFLEEVVSRDLKKTFLVCNMYPQHFHDKQTRLDVLNYVGGRILEASRRAGQRGPVRVYPVCALEAWQARQDDDIDMWKRSGADRLLRDIEVYLAEVAGRQALHESADRIVKAAEMAKAEVQVRQSLLEDPTKLATFRMQLDQSVRDLEAEFNEAVNSALRDVEPLKIKVRQYLLKPFSTAKKEVREAASADELEAFAGRFRRKVEVAGEEASRRFAAGLSEIVEKVRSALEQRFNAVMTDVSPSIGRFEISSTGMVLTPDAMQALSAKGASKTTAAATSVMGGVAGGGAVAMLTGAAMLGPIGLLGGALVGWKMSSLFGAGGQLKTAKEQVEARVDEIARELLKDLDREVDEALETIREAVGRRRKAFAADLYQQFDLVEGLAQDSDLVESYRRDAERFIVAFDACAARAQKAVQDA